MNGLLRFVLAALVRASPWIDAVVRRGGGLFILAALSFVAGWLLLDPATLRAYLRNSHEPCFRIAWVARITTGESEEPSPLVLIQTKWDRGRLNSDPKDKDSCRESEVLLSLPPLKESVYRRRDGVFVPLQKSRDRSTPRLPIPSELCLRATQRSNFNTTPECT